MTRIQEFMMGKTKNRWVDIPPVRVRALPIELMHGGIYSSDVEKHKIIGTATVTQAFRSSWRDEIYVMFDYFCVYTGWLSELEFDNEED